MIPLRLTVKNFMCYRDNVPTLELEDIHVACLCGENGHGKTALLDAITWVLWGQARARTQEELIHQGQQDMAVELEFMARGQRYRASRRYSRSARSRQGTTILELQVASDNGLRPITGNTVRETEARIRELLHMDYDTFVNTAFLLQGRADLFTRSSPAKRKEVLAEVLDLSYYQRLEERAKDWSREIEDRARDTDRAVALREQETVRKQKHQEKLASINSTLARIAPEEEAQRLKVEALREAVDSLKARQNEHEALAARLATGRGEIEDMGRQMQSHQARVGEYEAAQKSESDIRKQFQRLEEARTELERLDRAAFQATRLDQERARLKETIAVQRERLAGRVADLRNRIVHDLEPRAQRLPQIEESLRVTASEQSNLEELERSIQEQREEAQLISVRISYLEEANAKLLAIMEETRKRFDMLDQDGVLCPLCKQSLGTEGQEHLRREYGSNGLDAKRQHQEHTSEQSRLTRAHDDLIAQISVREAQLKTERQVTQSRVGGLERDLEDSKKARDELRRAGAELDQAQTLVTTDNYALEERQRLAKLDGALSSLGYEGEKHRDAQERVKDLEPFAELHRRLLEALEALPREREALETARQMLNRRRQEIERDERRRETLTRDSQSLPSLESELASAQSLHQTLERQTQEALVQRGILREQLDRLAKLEEELAELEAKRRGLVDEKSIADELAVAFGKNGIQALIIEAAIPELNGDADELLGRLSGMSLKLQLTQGRRDSRTGQPTEELQIKIGDEWGNTRSYETFSGGETFRIDFALRIALSKLLARRSGAPLPILFIDEGFGTQDSAGQDRLKEAIQSIQSDFQKIIVITHVDEVKESFPTRIEVTKTPSGSTFVVV
jgi:exonuclease SbcC